MKFGFDGLVVLQKKIFKNNGHIHVYSPEVGTDGDKKSLTKLFSQFSLLLQVFPIK